MDQNGSYRGQFRSDKKLLSQPEIEELIAKVWIDGIQLRNLHVSDLLRLCRKELSKWKRANNLNAKEEIKIIGQELDLEQAKQNPSFEQIVSLRKKLSFAYKDEETYWRQRCRQQWLKGGDKNSKYFHGAVKGQRARNRIEILKDNHGFFHRSEAAKAHIAVDYFRSLFTTANPVPIQNMFSFVQPRVTQEMNDDLIREVSDLEIREAIFAINPSKSAGPDGMSAFFYQKFWHIVGGQVGKEIKDFFRTGQLPEDWNYTHICLIPKVQFPEEMQQLRPISLCSVLYKTITKIISRRLKKWMPSIVSVHQSAFVVNRMITDNILVAQEVIHALNVDPMHSAESMAVKTDMSKAYDRVEWSYLLQLLKALGFNNRWINWVMSCVTSVTFSVLMNDKPFGLFKPSRGLRQGDPISSFLFVLCTEGLSHMISEAQTRNFLNGIRFSERGPLISHLLFADDSLFLCKATSVQAGNLMDLLEEYELVSGQKINKAKSAVTFGSKISENDKAEVKEALGIMQEGGSGSYLGLPESLAGSKVELFAFLKDRLNQRIYQWQNRFISPAGRENFIKSVATSLPIYGMSCFKIPKTTCNALRSKMENYWWGSSKFDMRIHWQSWDKMCLPKKKGGLGFRDLGAFNQALLAKQAWRLENNENSFFSQVYRSRYYDDKGVFLQAQIGKRPSYAWRSILHGRELLCLGLKRRIGDGKSTSVWLDSWLDDGVQRAPLRKNSIIDLELKVSDLFSPQNRQWDSEVLNEHFLPCDIELIKKQKPCPWRSDYFDWKATVSGRFTVQSAYALAMENVEEEFRNTELALPSLNDLKNSVWKLDTEPKIKLFLWKLLSDSLPAAKNLAERGMRIETTCQVCGDREENLNHIFFRCPLAKLIWFLSDSPSPDLGFDEASLYGNYDFFLSNSENVEWDKVIRRQFPWVLWRLWKNRNKFCIEGKRFDPVETVAKIKADMAVWFDAQQVGEEGENQKMNLKWQKPPELWKKCNIGFEWSKNLKMAGGSWVLRDSNGEVLLHSRRSFRGIDDKLSGQVEVMSWAVKSMVSHGQDKIFFECQNKNLAQSLMRPDDWPSFLPHTYDILYYLKALKEWESRGIGMGENRGAYLIAQSSIVDSPIHSYVAVGHPEWLNTVFQEEKSGERGK